MAVAALAIITVVTGCSPAAPTVDDLNLDTDTGAATDDAGSSSNTTATAETPAVETPAEEAPAEEAPAEEAPAEEAPAEEAPAE